MNILIIEDEHHAAKRLIKLIKSIVGEANILDVLDSVEASINWFNNNPHPDLIFLDIQLSDGMSFNIFRKVEVNCPVILTTAYDEFALQAFELNSIDYLLKPIDAEKLKKSLTKYEQRIKTYKYKNENSDLQKLVEFLASKTQKEYKTRFIVNKGNSLKIVEIDEIAYFFTENKQVYLYTYTNNKFLINTTLDKLEKQIETQKFYRANRQYLISVKSIKNIHHYFNYKLKLELNPSAPTDDIIISRNRTSDFKKWVAHSS